MNTPLQRHVAFYAAAAIGMAVLLAAFWLVPQLAIAVGANAFFATYLALVLRDLPKLTPAFLQQHAESADEPVWIIFMVTLATVAVAVGSLFVTINGKHTPDFLSFGVALASVFLGWFMIHAMAALHYAHLYWRPGNAEERGKKARGGLEFPGTPKPSGADFFYFAYVIGMTAQTSDVGISSSAMRSATLIHSIVSFFFNTVLVAAAVNVAVSLGQ